MGLRVNKEYEGATSTMAGADAMARKIASKSIAYEDVNPEVKEWKLESAVREAVKAGDLHQDQFLDELERRKDIGIPGRTPRNFTDQHPWRAIDGGLLVPFGTSVSPMGDTSGDASGDEEEPDW